MLHLNKSIQVCLKNEANTLKQNVLKTNLPIRDNIATNDTGAYGKSIDNTK